MAPRETEFQRVVRELRALIERSQPGDRLPGVRQIVEQFSTTNGTVSRAINELRAAGLIEARRKAGIFVRGYQPIQRSSPKRLSRDLWGAGYAIQDADTAGRQRSVDVEVGEGPPPDWAAGPLGVPAGQPAVFRRRTIVVDDRRVQLATSWLRTDVARGTPIMHTDTGPGGSYARLADMGLAPAWFVEYVRARQPDQREAEALHLSPGTAVLEITRHAHLDDERIVEVNRMILAGDAYLLDYTFPAA